MKLIQTLPREQVDELRAHVDELDFVSCDFKEETVMQSLDDTLFSQSSCTLEAARVPFYMYPEALKSADIADFFIMRDKPGYTFPNHKDERIPEGYRRLWFSLTDPEPGHFLVFPDGPLEYKAGEVYTWTKDVWHSIANVGFSPRIVAVLTQKVEDQVFRYYCHEKFDWLQVRLNDGFVSSCCIAEPDKLKLEDLEKPEGLFNYPQIIQDRKDMLAGKKIKGCQVCWFKENKGLPSRRTIGGGTDPYRTDLHQTPRWLNIALSPTCHQACVYCTKHFSTTWLKEIHDNQELFATVPHKTDRFTITEKDRLIHKLSQKKMMATKYTELIIEQIKQVADSIEEVVISGGEPLIDNHFVEVYETVKHTRVSVSTGLTVSESRLRNILSKIDKPVRFFLSAENTGKFHEFGRYGSKWDQFLANKEIIEEHGHEICFAPTLSNLTAFDFANFVRMFPGYRFWATEVNEPAFMHMSLLDPESKQKIREEWRDLEVDDIDSWIRLLDQDPDWDQLAGLHQYLEVLTKTRDIDLSIFPRHFLDWLNSGTT